MIRENEFLEQYRNKIAAKFESNEQSTELSLQNHIPSNNLIANIDVVLEFKKFLKNDELIKRQVECKRKVGKRNL